MPKNIKSIIDRHPQSKDIKSYIYSERFGGTGFRLISKGLLDLFDLKISHTGISNWLTLNPAPEKIEESEERVLNSDIFDNELYEEILPQNATEIEEIKAKYYTLIQCNVDNHIRNGKRLNSEYIKHLKMVLEVSRLELQSQELQISIADKEKEKGNSESIVPKIIIEQYKPPITEEDKELNKNYEIIYSNLTDEELTEMEKITKRWEEMIIISNKREQPQ